MARKSKKDNLPPENDPKHATGEKPESPITFSENKSEKSTRDNPKSTSSKSSNPKPTNSKPQSDSLSRQMIHIQRCSACRGRWEEKVNRKKFPYLKQSKRPINISNSPSKSKNSSKAFSEVLIANNPMSDSSSVYYSAESREYSLAKADKIKSSHSGDNADKSFPENLDSTTNLPSPSDNLLVAVENSNENINSDSTENNQIHINEMYNHSGFADTFSDDEHMLDEELDTLLSQDEEFGIDLDSTDEIIEDQKYIDKMLSPSIKTFSDSDSDNDANISAISLKGNKYLDIEHSDVNSTPTKKSSSENYWGSELSQMKSLKTSVDSALISRLQEIQAAYDEKVSQNRNLSALLEKEINKNMNPEKNSEIEGMFENSAAEKERILQHEAEANVAFNQLKGDYEVLLSEIQKKRLDSVSPKESYASPYINMAARKGRGRRITNGYDNQDIFDTPRKNLFPAKILDSYNPDSPFTPSSKKSARDFEPKHPTLGKNSSDTNKNPDWEQHSILTKLIKSAEIGKELISYLKVIEDDFTNKLSASNNKIIEVQNSLQEKDIEIKKLKRDHVKNEILDEHIYVLQSEKDSLTTSLSELRTHINKLEYEKNRLSISFEKSSEQLELLKNREHELKESKDKQKAKYEYDISSLKRQISNLLKTKEETEKSYQSEIDILKSSISRPISLKNSTSSELNIRSISPLTPKMDATEYNEPEPETIYLQYKNVNQSSNFLKYKQLSESNASIKSQLNELLEKYNSELLNSSKLANKLRIAYNQIETFEKKWSDPDSLDFYKESSSDRLFHKNNRLANFGIRKSPLKTKKGSKFPRSKVAGGRNRKDNSLRSFSDGEMDSFDSQYIPNILSSNSSGKRLSELHISNKVFTPSIDLEFKGESEDSSNQLDSDELTDSDSNINRYYLAQQKNRNKTQPPHQTGRITKPFTFTKSLRTHQKTKTKSLKPTGLGDLASELEKAQSNRLSDDSSKDSRLYGIKNQSSRIGDITFDPSQSHQPVLKVDKFTSTDDISNYSPKTDTSNSCTQTEGLFGLQTPSFEADISFLTPSDTNSSPKSQKALNPESILNTDNSLVKTDKDNLKTSKHLTSNEISGSNQTTYLSSPKKLFSDFGAQVDLINTHSVSEATIPSSDIQRDLESSQMLNSTGISALQSTSIFTQTEEVTPIQTIEIGIQSDVIDSKHTVESSTQTKIDKETPRTEIGIQVEGPKPVLTIDSGTQLEGSDLTPTIDIGIQAENLSNIDTKEIGTQFESTPVSKIGEFVVHDDNSPKSIGKFESQAENRTPSSLKDVESQTDYILSHSSDVGTQVENGTQISTSEISTQAEYSSFDPTVEIGTQTEHNTDPIGSEVGVQVDSSLIISTNEISTQIESPPFVSTNEIATQVNNDITPASEVTYQPQDLSNPILNETENLPRGDELSSANKPLRITDVHLIKHTSEVGIQTLYNHQLDLESEKPSSQLNNNELEYNAIKLSKAALVDKYTQTAQISDNITPILYKDLDNESKSTYYNSATSISRHIPDPVLNSNPTTADNYDNYSLKSNDINLKNISITVSHSPDGMQPTNVQSTTEAYESNNYGNNSPYISDSQNYSDSMKSLRISYPNGQLINNSTPIRKSLTVNNQEFKQYSFNPNKNNLSIHGSVNPYFKPTHKTKKSLDVSPSNASHRPFYPHTRSFSMNSDRLGKYINSRNAMLGSSSSHYSKKLGPNKSNKSNQDSNYGSNLQVYPSKNTTTSSTNFSDLNENKQFNPLNTNDDAYSKKENINTILYSLHTTKYSSSVINSSKVDPILPRDETVKKTKPHETNEDIQKSFKNITSVVSTENKAIHNEPEEIDHKDVEIHDKEANDKLPEEEIYDYTNKNEKENPSKAQELASIAKNKDSIIPNPSTQASPDPLIVQAVARSMVGSYMYKFSSKVSPNELKHEHSKYIRYFWVHPYTKIISWSKKPPTSNNVKQNSGSVFGFGDLLRNSSSKTLYIGNVKSIIDRDGSVNSDDFLKYSIIVTSGRSTIRIKALTLHEHELWLRALSYLQSRNVITSDSYNSDRPSQIDGRPYTPNASSQAIASNRSSNFYYKQSDADGTPNLSEYNSPSKHGRHKSLLSLIRFPKKSIDSNMNSIESPGFRSVHNFPSGHGSTKSLNKPNTRPSHFRIASTSNKSERL
ncbi:Anucleate primary sterigmata protein A [Smittium culicis]|uniref:Anucleate primary sterigmata protein A n=1 Tax=Smittium culicis TaxID=133412 RepID=A0A1R1Y2A8_9FUNG|nr:Anucleate primary sterigmata protein A [Smittium culicis]